MKRENIKVFVLTAIFVCSVSASMAQSNTSNESIVGTWKMDGRNSTFEFKQDGTYVLQSSYSSSGTYKISEQLIIFVETGGERKFSIKDNTLTLSNKDGSFAQTYTRVTEVMIAQEQQKVQEQIKQEQQKMQEKQQKKLAEREILYIGTTKFEDCEVAIFSFVLDAKKIVLNTFQYN